MMYNKQIAEKYIYWRLKSGICFLWWDDWLGVGPLHYFSNDPIRFNNIKVSQLWGQGKLDVERLN